MNIAIDTNRLVDYFRGDPIVERTLSEGHRIAVPLVVIGELKAGIRVGSKQAANEAVLLRFLSKPIVDILLPDEETCNHCAQLFVQLRRAGTPIPDNDLWIAALVVQHRLHLLTRDKHFGLLPQVQLLE
ncbi:MAG: type II toxin-antitoxin system VapC family toxin [Bryobacterales bacterium]|nr:type II toxin-antitoxin system VapC family toxin [Bryobacterales bacterium]